MSNQDGRHALWEPWENAVSQSSILLKRGLVEMEGTFKSALSTMERTISEKAEKSLKNFEDRIQKLEASMQGIKDKTRQREEEASKKMEELIQKRLEETIKTVEERLQKKMEKEMQSIQERTQKNMMEALRVVEGGRKQLIKDEVRAMEERTVEKIEESIRTIEVSMPEKVEQTIRENDERMNRLESMVRGRERRAHDLMQKIEENFVKSDNKLSSSAEISSKPTPEHVGKIEDRIAEVESFVQISVSSMFTRVETLISQIEQRPAQGNSTSSGTSTGADLERCFRNAAKDGDIASVRAALASGSPIDCHCPSGLTALHWASREGHSAVVKLLLDGGADVDRGDNHGWTALHSAAERNRVDCVELLIAHGADVERADEYGWTPLHVAANCGHAPSTRALVQAGADRDKRNRFGESPLDVTYRIAIRHLLRQRADANEGRDAPGADVAPRNPGDAARYLRQIMRQEDGSQRITVRPRARSTGRSPHRTPLGSSQSPFKTPHSEKKSTHRKYREHVYSGSMESLHDDGFTYKNENNDYEYF